MGKIRASIMERHMEHERETGVFQRTEKITANRNILTFLIIPTLPAER